MSFRRWLWIDDILLPLAVLILRLCWLWPWLELARRWVTPHVAAPFLPLPAMALLGAGGYVAANLALRRDAISGAVRATVIGCGLIMVAFLLWLHYAGPFYAPWDSRGFLLLAQQATDWRLGPPPAFVGLVVGVWLWIQGVQDAKPLSRHEQVWQSFALGFLAIVVMVLVVQLDPRGLPPGAGAAVWIFFGVGMAAMALSALEYAGLGQGKEAAIPGMSRYWLGSMLIVVGGVLGIGLLVILVLAPGTVAAALANLRFLLDWLGAILGVILIVLAYLIFLVIEPIFNFLREYMELPEPEEETVDTQSLNDMLESFWADPRSILPEAVADSLPWVAILLTGLAMAVAVTIALRLLRKTEDTSYVETRESVFSVELLEAQLATLWQRLTGRGDRPLHEPFLSLAGEEDRRRAVRAVYQEFLAHMQALGRPRPRQWTPGSYGARIEQALRQMPAPALGDAEGHAAALETLTAGYVQARYGDEAPTVSQVEAVQDAWRRLQAYLDRPAAEQRADAPAQPDADPTPPA